MSKEFNPGDLALVIHSRNSENIGRVVTVTGFAPQGTLVPHEFGATRCITDAWAVSGNIITDRPSNRDEKLTVTAHAFKGTSLMPLKGDEQPAQVRQAERVQ